jgi:enoyl-CoA hydratase
VAALTGYALGSGLALALAADWRVSGDNVKFGATEILAGLAPDGSGLARLAQTIGASRAKELAYSGRFFDAEEALALGLIDDMVAPDGVYDAAVGWARRFVDTSASALAAVKTSIDSLGTVPPAERAVADQRRYGQLFGTGMESSARGQ